MSEAGLFNMDAGNDAPSNIATERRRESVAVTALWESWEQTSEPDREKFMLRVRDDFLARCRERAKAGPQSEPERLFPSRRPRPGTTAISCGKEKP